LAGSLAGAFACFFRDEGELAGAMIAFEIFVESQTGHATKPRFNCPSLAFEFGNQLSNV
jgi:hypothetical protein